MRLMILSYSNIGHTSWLNLKATNLIIVKTLKLFFTLVEMKAIKVPQLSVIM